MKPTKAGIIAAAAVATGGVALAGTAVASGSATTPIAAAAATVLQVAESGDAQGGPPAPHEHTDVTGDELADVKAAVAAEHDDVTVESVRKDPDGSYDVLGTRSGAPVMLEVSADLKTITERTGGPGHGRGGPGPHGFGQGGPHEHTTVTGAELAKVTAAVEDAKPAVTVESVVQDPDGSYDVFGSRSGEPVMLEVSADLKTITEHPGGPGRGDPGALRQDGTSSGTTPETGATT